MSMPVMTFPLREGETRLIATSPTVVLHEASAALPRAATGITTIEAILLAAPVRGGGIILGGRPKLGRWRVTLRCVVEGHGLSFHGLRRRGNSFHFLCLNDVSIHFLSLSVSIHCQCLSGNICAIPHRVMGVHPMSMVIRALPLRKGEACFVTTGPPRIFDVTSAALPRTTP